MHKLLQNENVRLIGKFLLPILLMGFLALWAIKADAGVYDAHTDTGSATNYGGSTWHGATQRFYLPTGTPVNTLSVLMYRYNYTSPDLTVSIYEGGTWATKSFLASTTLTLTDLPLYGTDAIRWTDIIFPNEFELTSTTTGMIWIEPKDYSNGDNSVFRAVYMNLAQSVRTRGYTNQASDTYSDHDGKAIQYVLSNAMAGETVTTTETVTVYSSSTETEINSLKSDVLFNTILLILSTALLVLYLLRRV